jgi:membrane protein DedA with SNARE-associated domain
MITVFIPALLPIPLPLKVFILSAGALGVKPWTFAGVVLAARTPRYFGLAWLGAKLGHNSAAWLKDHSKELLLAAALLAAALFLLVKLAGRRRAATSV